MNGVSARLDLLDQQLVDCEGARFGRVDEVELRFGPDGAPDVVALLVGAEALGRRLGGRLGDAMAATAARLRPREHPTGPPRIDQRLIDPDAVPIRLRVRLDDLGGVVPLEHWLSRHVISRLAGSRS